MMFSEISENEILNSFSNLLTYLPHFFEEDVSFAVTDREKFLIQQNGKDLILNTKQGDPIPEGGGVFAALRTGIAQVKNVPKEVYGIPFRSYAIPLREGNNVVGVVVLAKSFQKKNEVISITQNISTAVQQITAAINDLVFGVQKLNEMNTTLLCSTQDTNDKVKGTGEIIKFIKDIAVQTNLLGVNASIESARAGESGKGFKVVALEIGKLSNSSSDSIKKIDAVLNNIRLSVNTIDDQLSESTAIFQNQAADLEEIAAAIQELNTTSQMLEKLSEKL